ncbi:TorF family putative porin [Sphingomonas sp.]|uniref:TorF family putative porin n=1 Tax=Sphingomonas sp. TaxID=28214 RepID=UPI002DBC46D8|nr:TorF family putative porin [Sphingomonas sp.]HEU4967878.1 TorF family putative porin [Sphingomonas sp.]
MRPATHCLLACAATACSSAAAAGDPQFSLSAEASLVSDYRYRGASLTGNGPAVQGGVTVEHESGLYAGVWASSLAGSDEDVPAEVDLIGGYAADLAGGFSIDANVTWYRYPGARELDYAEGGATLSRPVRGVTPQIGISYVPAQSATRDASGRDQDNFYVFAGLDVPVPGSSVTLHGQAGHEAGAFDLNEQGGKWDWQLGARLELERLSFDLSYVDSNRRSPLRGTKPVAGPALVAQIKVSL